MRNYGFIRALMYILVSLTLTLTSCCEGEHEGATQRNTEVGQARLVSGIKGRTTVLKTASTTPNNPLDINSGTQFHFRLVQAGGEEEESATDAGSDKVLAPARHAAAAKKSGSVSYTDPETGMEFVLVKGGCYQMGDTFGDGWPNEKPVIKPSVALYGRT